MKRYDPTMGYYDEIDMTEAPLGGYCRWAEVRKVLESFLNLPTEDDRVERADIEELIREVYAGM